MKESFRNFNDTRMKIFGELVKNYWDGKINSVEDLNKLAIKIKNDYGFEDDDLTFILDHIRVAMWIDPNGNEEFIDELDIVKKSNAIKTPVISKINGACEHCEHDDCTCSKVCKYEALIYKKTEGPIIVNDKCVSCGDCIDNCEFGTLADKIEFMPLIELLKNKKQPIYASVAPALVGQFGENVSMGQVRTALKLMGFDDMIETAMFADILTIKEAFEFSHLVNKEEDFFLTSCCCPIWFNMTKKSFNNLYNHMSPSVSPMIASGRILKELYNDAKVVFIAPCVAKKSEIKEEDLVGAIDFVLNFRELEEIFNALNINLEELPSDDKDQASLGGRLYARTGGVSFAVKTVVNRLEPTRLIKLKPKKVHGAKACKDILKDLSTETKMDANFIEGMGCDGGCVGGPRTIIDKEIGLKAVNEFGEDSLILTPFDNLNVMKILKQFGLEVIDEIVDNEKLNDMLTRK